MSGEAATDDIRVDLAETLGRLHVHKDADYGDAWRRRGEVLGIFANLARKYDRLQQAFADSEPGRAEPLADNVADLVVYGCKYLTWIAEGRPDAFDRASLPINASTADARNGPSAVTALLRSAASVRFAALEDGSSSTRVWQSARQHFESLEEQLLAQPPGEVYPLTADYTQRAQITWRLVVELLTLLAILKAEQPGDVAELESLIARMGDEAES